MRQLSVSLILFFIISGNAQAQSKSLTTENEILSTLLLFYCLFAQENRTEAPAATAATKEGEIGDSRLISGHDEKSYGFHSFSFEPSDKTDLEVAIGFKDQASIVSHQGFLYVEGKLYDDHSYQINLKIPQSTDENQSTSSLKVYGSGVPEIVSLKDDAGVYTPKVTRSKFQKQIKTPLNDYLFQISSYHASNPQHYTVMMMTGGGGGDRGRQPPKFHIENISGNQMVIISPSISIQVDGRSNSETRTTIITPSNVQTGRNHPEPPPSYTPYQDHSRIQLASPPHRAVERHRSPIPQRASMEPSETSDDDEGKR